MKLRYFFAFFLSFFLSCKNDTSNQTQKKNPETTDEQDSKKFKSLEERFTYEVKKKLTIKEDEKFDMRVYYEDLNSDDKKDAVITVNLLDRAINESAKSNNPAKRAELGYLGSYNFFFYYDGNKDAISVPIMIGSSAKSPLKVSFKNIQSDFYKDIVVEYKIRNGSFINYYAIFKETLQLVFSWKVYDLIGEEKYEANYYDYADGTFSLVKDILIYKGEIENYSTNVENLYTYNPKIKKTKDLLYRFFYDPKRMKYVTNSKPNEQL